MTPLEAAAIFGAGLAAGTINTIVGSGSLITFPTLLAFGYRAARRQRLQHRRPGAGLAQRRVRIPARAGRPATAGDPTGHRLGRRRADRRPAPARLPRRVRGDRAGPDRRRPGPGGGRAPPLEGPGGAPPRRVAPVLAAGRALLRHGHLRRLLRGRHGHHHDRPADDLRARRHPAPQRPQERAGGRHQRRRRDPVHRRRPGPLGPGAAHRRRLDRRRPGGARVGRRLPAPALRLAIICVGLVAEARLLLG